MPLNVLAVVAHPDDEVLGCGGTLAKHAEAGDDVFVIVLSRLELHRESNAAAEKLGIGKVWNHPFPDQRLDTIPLAEIAEQVFDYVDVPGREEKFLDPDVVYTHWPYDLNLDHELTARAVLTAFRPPYFQGTLLAFETLSSTEWGVRPFQPNWYEQLSQSQMDKKIAALRCYESELRPQPHPRNPTGVLNKAVQRGDEACVHYAEAFHLLRRGPR